MEEAPNYYAIIPATVRYDKRLKPNEKLIYGEITALASKTGECFASNNYFANLFSVKPNAISCWINDLKKFNYIEVELIYSGKEIEKRIIRLKGVSLLKEVGTIQKSGRGTTQKGEDNNTRNNIDISITTTTTNIDNKSKSGASKEDDVVDKKISKKDIVISSFKKPIDTSKLELYNLLLKYADTEFEYYVSNETFKSYIHALACLNDLNKAAEVVKISIDKKFANIKYIIDNFNNFNKSKKSFAAFPKNEEVDTSNEVEEEEKDYLVFDTLEDYLAFIKDHQDQKEKRAVFKSYLENKKYKELKSRGEI